MNLFFPKIGAHDFCLRIVDKCGSWFASVPDAELEHPWWSQGQLQYRRFARWVYGDSPLPKLHPKYRYRNAPNFLETTLLLLPFVILAFFFFKASIQWFLIWVAIAIPLELLMDGLRMKVTRKKQAAIVSVQATLIRLSNDLGRLAGHFKNLHMLGITERFDYFMTGEHIRYEQKIGLAKFFVYLTLALVLFIVFK